MTLRLRAVELRKTKSVREVSRLLGVPRSTVGRWTRGTPLKAPKAKSGTPRRDSGTPGRDLSTKTVRRKFRGAHYWHWTATIAEVGRDLLLPEKRELKHTAVWWGPWDRAGFPATVELHRGRRAGSRPGSVVVRFSLDAKPGETPYELRDRATWAVGEVLSSIARERRIQFGTVTLSNKPHYEGEGEALAGLAGRSFRVTTQDAYGKVWIDWSRPGTREANTPESLAAYLRVDGNLQAALEELKAVREGLRALPEVVGALRSLSDEIRGVRGPEDAPKAPARPEGGYG